MPKRYFDIAIVPWVGGFYFNQLVLMFIHCWQFSFHWTVWTFVLIKIYTIFRQINKFSKNCLIKLFFEENFNRKNLHCAFPRDFSSGIAANIDAKSLRQTMSEKTPIAAMIRQNIFAPNCSKTRPTNDT